MCRLPGPTLRRANAGMPLILMVLILTLSCATDGDSDQGAGPSSRSILDGDKPFRGRWWSYYERGQEHAERGDWAMARRDFETAQAARSTDQLWARTYGMHFVSEYFPNRELGIALYYEDRLDEAEEMLKRSQSQQPSARAEYFLNEIRRRLLELKGPEADRAPPAIAIHSPDAVGSPRVRLQGDVTDDTFVVALDINGRPYDIREARSNVSFSRTIDVRPGTNVITLQAGDLSGKTTKLTFEIHADLDGPVVIFDEFGQGDTSIAGIVSDPAGVASVKINGRPVRLDEAFSRRSAFRTELAQPIADFEAYDRHGNVTAGILQAGANQSLTTAYPRARYARLHRPAARVARAIDYGRASQAVFALNEPIVRPASNSLIRIVEPADESVFYQDIVPVTIKVPAVPENHSIKLNGTEILLHGVDGTEGTVHVSRAIRLALGINDITAELVDTEGRIVGSAQLRLRRELTSIESSRGRLSASLLGHVIEGHGLDASDHASGVTSDIHQRLFEEGRFRLINRDLLDEILTEHELTALLSPNETDALFAESLWPEIVFVGRIHRHFATIEIIMHAISTESLLYLSRADVAGAPEELDRLIQLLVERVVANFPRREGQVFDVRDAEKIRLKPRIVVSREQWLLANPEYTGFANDVCTGVQRELFRQSRRVLLTDVDPRGSQRRSTEEEQATWHDATSDDPQAVHVLHGEFRGHANGIVLRATMESVSPLREAEQFELELPVAPEGGIDAGVQLAREAVDWLAERGYGNARVPVYRAFNTSLGGAVEGFRESMKLVIYRTRAESTDETSASTAAALPEILGEAIVRRVDDDSSVATLLINSRAGAPQLIREGDFVIVK